MSRPFGSDKVSLPNYYGTDTGCNSATAHLKATTGEKSKCLECPFPTCKEDNRRIPKPYNAHIRTIDRDREMRSAFNGGKTIHEVALLFGVNYKLAWGILRRKK